MDQSDVRLKEGLDESRDTVGHLSKYPVIDLCNPPVDIAVLEDVE